MIESQVLLKKSLEVAGIEPRTSQSETDSAIHLTTCMVT